MAKVYIEAEGPEAWQRLLAEPEKHWRTGFSARTLAHCWHASPGLPQSVARVLATSDDRALRRLEVLLAVPEHQVPLPGGGHASQTDLWVLGRDQDGLVSIAVEGKADEPFDDTTSDWLLKREQRAAKRGATSGAGDRLQFLCGTLNLEWQVALTLRYQLLHRTAAALIEANRFTAAKAVMLVHSFSPTRSSFDQFARFAAAFGATAESDRLIAEGNCEGIALHLGWVSGEPEFLGA